MTILLIVYFFKRLCKKQTITYKLSQLDICEKKSCLKKDKDGNNTIFFNSHYLFFIFA